MCLFANCSSPSARIMVLPKLTFVLLCLSPLYSIPFSFVLYSFLLWRLGNNLWYAPYGFDVAQHVRKARSETKCNDTPWVSDTPTFKSINEVHALTIEHFVMAALIVEILFMLFSVYNAALRAENEWIWSVLANRFLVGYMPRGNNFNLFWKANKQV